jgi:hypothetical protein
MGQTLEYRAWARSSSFQNSGRRIGNAFTEVSYLVYINLRSYVVPLQLRIFQQGVSEERVKTAAELQDHVNPI